jgi:hypothetical protein
MLECRAWHLDGSDSNPGCIISLGSGTISWRPQFLNKDGTRASWLFLEINDGTGASTS